MKDKIITWIKKKSTEITKKETIAKGQEFEVGMKTAYR